MEDVSPALQQRLGPDAAVSLLSLLETAHQKWSAEVTAVTIQRFEQRLDDDIGKFRLELRDEIGKVRVELRQEIAMGDAQLREEMRNAAASLREDFRDQRLDVAKALTKLEVNLTWRLFGMWVGQLVAMAAIVAAMFRIYEP